jgi:tetrahydromethanopterin S-methyltransferase subunit G
MADSNGHNGCGSHEAVVERLHRLETAADRLDSRVSQHCNGGSQHVLRREMDAIMGRVGTVEEKVDAVVTEQKVGTARLTLWQGVLVALLALVGSVAGTIINALAQGIAK